MKESVDQNMVALYDSKACDWEAQYDTPYFKDRLRVYDRWLTSIARGTVGGTVRALDIGCGTFPASAVFAQHHISAVGVDVSPKMIEIGKALGRNALLYDGVSLPFDGGTFSLVTMMNCIESVTQPSELFADILRVSQPNVKILMTINNQDALVKKLLRLRRGQDCGSLGEWYSPYSVASLRELVAPFGFHAPRVFAYSLPTLYERAPRILRLPVFRNSYCANNVYLEIGLSRDRRADTRG